ncbi:MAG: MotA/TolQ/ExbB proton channel family protein, partial [Proteobacteria bacterium]|nr:MotA/TolQ/ExbB proton channel family protein [Pseudomonadota bacterium]
RVAALPAPKLLAPMASMLAARETPSRDSTGRARLTLSATAMRSLLDSLASRLDESRELSRYMTGLLIFLGLLGTFWGLLRTIGAVSDVIGSMSVTGGDVATMFDQLKTGLAKPLGGMSTAFSASMFGLSGALVLGFLDLTAGQAQNRFFNELEEWLAGLTRLSSGVLSEGEGGSVPVYVQALLEQTAENMEGLQRVLARGEDRGAQTNQTIVALTERLSALTDTMRTNQQLMLRIAETQTQLGPALARLAEARHESQHDETARAHLRNIELYLQRLLTDAEQGRAQATAELRSDLRILTRTVAALAEEPPR